MCRLNLEFETREELEEHEVDNKKFQDHITTIPSDFDFTDKALEVKVK